MKENTFRYERDIIFRNIISLTRLATRLAHRPYVRHPSVRVAFHEKTLLLPIFPQQSSIIHDFPNGNCINLLHFITRICSLGAATEIFIIFEIYFVNCGFAAPFLIKEITEIIKSVSFGSLPPASDGWQQTVWDGPQPQQKINMHRLSLLCQTESASN